MSHETISQSANAQLMSDPQWTTVEAKRGNRGEGEPVQLSKAQRKHQRQKEKKRHNRAIAAAGEGSDTDDDIFDIGRDDPAIARALEESLHLARSPSVQQQQDRPAPDSPSVIVRRLQKKLTQIVKLEAREGLLSAAEREKLARKPELLLELAEAEAEIAAQKAAAVAAVEDERHALASVTKVEFDSDRFGCPICLGVLDAATTLSACKHTFCRECLETALQAAIHENMNTQERIEAVVCPLCRTQLFDQKEQKVLTKPATKLKKKLAKAIGKCHCGDEVPLSMLREHLRGCGPGAEILYQERKQYKNEFEQPAIVVGPSFFARAGWKITPRAYNEDDALQEALAESMRLASSQ